MIRELSDFEVKALHYELLLKDIITTAEKLPPFPDVAWKVVALIRKTAPVKELEAAIKLEPAITARVLALSRSAYYGRRRDVRSLEEAIVLLGGQRLVQVVLAACSAQYFQCKISGYEVNDRELWQHSVAAAIMSEKLARRLRHKKLLTIYTAALLHDIGKTVLDLYAKIYLHSSLQQIRSDGVEIIEAERRALGIDHQELGEIISRRWRFPSEVISAIGYHHSPFKAPSDQDVAAIVYATDRLVTALTDKESFIDPDRDPVFKKLGITTHIAEELLVDLAGAMGEVNDFLVGN